MIWDKGLIYVSNPKKVNNLIIILQVINVSTMNYKNKKKRLKNVESNV